MSTNGDIKDKIGKIGGFFNNDKNISQNIVLLDIGKCRLELENSLKFSYSWGNKTILVGLFLAIMEFVLRPDLKEWNKSTLGGPHF